jgi:hypothetical protein
MWGLRLERRFYNLIEPTIVENFIDPEDILLLNDLIEKEKIFNKFIIDASDNRIFEWNPDYSEAIYLVKKYSKKIIKDQDLYPHVALFVKYLPGAFIPVHTDIMSDKCLDDKLAVVLYFNDDYYGGEIYFPLLNKEYKTKSGSAIYYPITDKEFEHGVNPVMGGEKYIITICFTSNKDFASNQYCD